VLGIALGAALRRPRPLERWLGLALPWLLWADPGLVRSLGFLLSVGAVGGILFFLELWGRTRRWLVPLIVSLGAQWGTLFIIVDAFGQLSPLATLPNLLVIPLTALFLPAVLFSTLTALSGPLGGLFVEAARLLGRAIETVIATSSCHLPFLTGWPPPPSVVLVLFPVLLILWFSLPAERRRTGRVRAMGVASAALLVIGGLVPGAPPPGPWVAFLDVGQGDAAVLRLSDGTVWVVDVGDDRGPGDAARNALIPFFRHQRLRRVDGLVLSHRHRDHVGALGSFLEAVRTERVYDAGFGSTRGTPGRVDSILAAHGLWPCLVAAGDTLHPGRRPCVVAAAPERGDPQARLFGDSLNNVSLVIRVEDGPLSVLFAGDLETEGETACLRSFRKLAARILKVGHHGASTSTTPEFLRAVAPEWAVISCGEGNRFRHPSPRTLDRLHQAGISVLRTDRDGGVVFTLAEGELRARTHPPHRPHR
jgi:competence protein ComEC